MSALTLIYLAAAGRPSRLTNVGRRRYFLVLLLLLYVLTQQPAASQAGAENGRIVPRHALMTTEGVAPLHNLSLGYHLPRTYHGPADLTEALQNNQARPLSLTAADFDENGTLDLVSGYGVATGGAVVIQRGQPASAETAPFSTEAWVWAAPCAPDFVGAGDFNADGHADLVLGARGGQKLVWWSGDGRGNLQTAGESVLPGTLMALAVGEVNRPDGLPEVVVGLETSEGVGQVLVLEGPNGAGLATAEGFATNAPVRGLALGALDGDAVPDVAVVAGRELLLIAGRDRKLSLRVEEQGTVRPAQISRRVFPRALRDAALGDFTGDGRLDAAVLTAGGVVNILRQPAAKKPAAWTAWQAEAVTPGEVWAGVERLMAARVTGLPVASVVGLGGDGARILGREAMNGAESRATNGRLRLSATRWAEAELTTAVAAMAILPMRVNGDALDDLVILQPGASAPLVIPSAPAAIFTVNSSADTDDGFCNTANCTLREALKAANANTGLDEVRFNIPAGNSPNREARVIGSEKVEGDYTKQSASVQEKPATDAPTVGGDLDTGFNPSIAANSSVYALVVQSDGKVVIGGDFTGVNGVARGHIARLNPDGTLDTTFGNGQVGTDFEVRTLAVQPDGKVVIGGFFSMVNGVARFHVARLNADGTLDINFGNGGANGGVFTLALQPDGKIVIGGIFSVFNGVARNRIARLNADGTLDTAFGNGLEGANNGVRALAVQSDGKVVIGGDFTSVNGVARNRIARLNADGTLDTAFGNGLEGANNGVRALAVQSDGKVVIGGDFTSVNGVARNRIARLSPDGMLDITFGSGLSGVSGGNSPQVDALEVQSDGKVIIGGNFNVVNGVFRNGIARLNPSGTLDFTFGEGLSGVVISSVFALDMQTDGKVVLGGNFSAVNGVVRNAIASLNADGTLNTAFGNGLAGATSNFGLKVGALALQPDGKIVIGGVFAVVNGVARSNIARLNADGTLDTTFGNGLGGASSEVRAISVQADGKVVAGGYFTLINGVARFHVARLNPDGTPDLTFGDPAVNTFVEALAVQPDRKVIIGGRFNTVNGVTRNDLARLNADGTLDTDFGNGLSGANSFVFAMAVQTNGQIVIGGSFFMVNGMVRFKVARLNPDGTLDATFDNPGVNDTVTALAVQPDGKIVIGGVFTTVTNGVARNRIARLNADGTLDTTFGGGQFGANNSISALALQPDGKVLIGGDFTAVNGVGRNRIARLNTDGTLDTTFGNGAAGVSNSVSALAAQLDGSVVLGGSFTNVNDAPRTGLARLLSGTNIQFFRAAYTANENAGTAIISVTRDSSTGAASVNYATSAAGTATGGTVCSAGVDYLTTSGTLSWAAGDSSPKTFALTLCDDNLPEGNETANLALSNPSGGTLGATNTAILTIVDNSCLYAINPTQANILASGGNGSTNITTSAGCPWAAVSNASDWLTIQNGNSGNGNGLVTFTAQPNPGPARIGTLTIAGQTLTVFQDGGVACSYSVSPLSRSFTAAGGNGTINIFSVPGTCPWTATSNNPSFLSITGGPSGTGSGQIRFDLTSNTSGIARAGTITITGEANFTQIFAVVQGFTNGNRRTITLNSPLPTIIEPIIIDGSTQPGFAGVPLIEINGQNLTGADGHGLNITGGGSTIRSLALNRFANAERVAAIRLITNGNNVVEGCYIGTDASGTGGFAPTNSSGLASGIFMQSSPGNRIGGTTAAQRNLIAGIDGRGVVLADSANNNLVQGNAIGSDITGSLSLGRQRIGVTAQNANFNTIGGTTAGARNVISGNLDYGVFLQDDAQNNLVQGNNIGTNGAGVVPVANGNAGVFLFRPSGPTLMTMNTVGGTTPAARNVIAGNEPYGVVVGVGATATLVQGNYIGTNASGAAAVPNTYGITVTQATGSTIGGDPTNAPNARNVIAGNRLTGLFMGALNNGQVGISGSTVQNNYIGTNAAGDAALANQRDGVFVEVQSVTNNILNNRIAFNGANGVRIPNVTDVPGTPTPAFRINIESNEIYGNAAMSIDLGETGVTPNDPLDEDNGANLQQNYPVLMAVTTASASCGAGQLTIRGTINARPDTNYSVQSFYSNVSQCQSVRPQPLPPFRMTPALTDSSGNANFEFCFAFPPGQTSGVVYCDTLDPANSGSSEYSDCLAVSSTPLAVTINDVTMQEGNSGTRAMQFTVTRTGNVSQPLAVNYAAAPADGTATPGTDYVLPTVGVLNFAANQTSQALNVTINGDTQQEFDETLFVNLRNADGATFAAGRGTIINDDGALTPALQFSQVTFNVNEGAGGASVMVNRTGNTATAVTVDYATNDDQAFVACNTVNGQANQRCDYTASSGALNFAAGETSKTFTVPLLDDTFVEGNETLTVSLSNPSGGATLGAQATATLTITDDDTAILGPRTYLARLNAAQEVPANNSAAVGTGTVTLNEAENQITVNMSFSGLGSAQTAAHIHGLAPVGVNAPVLFNLGTGTITNAVFSVTPTQVAQLKAGLMYFNVHTANFSNGEIRGQVLLNPLESARYFVRQQYADFLSREPDQAGEDFWTGQIVDVAGTDLTLIKQRRVAVSNAFFFEQEYQQTGAYVYRLYRAAFGNTQPFPNPGPNSGTPILAAQVPSYVKFVADRARVVGGANLAATQLSLATAFAQRTAFVNRYPLSLATGAQFVDALLATLQSDLSVNLSGQRTTLITQYDNAGGGNAGRSAVLFRLAQDDVSNNPVNNRAFIDAEYNRAFVITQYFGYLRRDGDLGGLNFWLSVVNQFPLRSATGQNGMVCAFITSAEYQTRFGPGVTRSNQSDCQ